MYTLLPWECSDFHYLAQKVFSSPSWGAGDCQQGCRESDKALIWKNGSTAPKGGLSRARGQLGMRTEALPGTEEGARRRRKGTQTEGAVGKGRGGEPVGAQTWAPLIITDDVAGVSKTTWNMVCRWQMTPGWTDPMNCSTPGNPTSWPVRWHLLLRNWPALVPLKCYIDLMEMILLFYFYSSSIWSCQIK